MTAVFVSNLRYSVDKTSLSSTTTGKLSLDYSLSVTIDSKSDDVIDISFLKMFKSIKLSSWIAT